MATVLCLRNAARLLVRALSLGLCAHLVAGSLNGCAAPAPARSPFAPRALRSELQHIETRIGDPASTAETERRSALALLDQVLKAHPRTYRALERRAELRLAWDQETAALEDLATLEEYFGPSAYHTALRGRALYQGGRPEEATGAFRAALEIDRDNTDALLHLGMILAEHARFDEARKYFQRVAEIDPQNRSAESYAAMMDETQASLAARNNHTDNGTQVEGGAAPAEPDTAWRQESDPLDLKHGGLLLLKAGEFERATEILLSAARGLPKDGELLRACARSFARQGKDGAAAEVLLYGSRVDPDDAETQFFLGVVAARLGRKAETYHDVSAEAFAAAARLQPERTEAFIAAAKAFAERGDLEAAVTHFEGALQIGGDASAFLDYGGFLAETRDWVAAAAMFEDGVKRYPDHQDLQANLMVAYFHVGAVDKARALRRMLERNPAPAAGARSLLAIYREEIGR